MTLSARFIEFSHGSLFCVLRKPVHPVEPTAVLVAPAFGDEMNKSRRMLTELGIRLNKEGIALINPDLFGTGDSDGDFSEATWRGWITDLIAILDWAQEEGMRVRGILGIRTGRLLAREMIRIRPELAFEIGIFWQGVLSGAAFVRQLLRIRTMQRAFEGRSKETIDELRRRISGSEILRVGGYPLTRHVIDPLSNLELTDNDSSGFDQVISLNVSRVAEVCSWKCSTDGRESASATLPGEPFWNATETVVNEHLLCLTTRILRERLG